MTTAVILAGGKGSRIIEESIFKPKPMIEVGKEPILIHIMRIFSKHNINNFIICAGYKKEVIKKYFKKNIFSNWNIQVVDTGLNTMTGGRIKKIEKYLNKSDPFFLATYGDGVSNINIKKLIRFHKKQKKIATLTAVFPQNRYGLLKSNNKNIVTHFSEKPNNTETIINGGFFVFNREIFNFIKKPKSILEKETLSKLTKKKQLCAFKHKGFWYAMDTMRDKYYLENLIKKRKAPWI